MFGTKCPTVRSGGTTSFRSALMPILMTSRASMETSVPAYAGTTQERKLFFREAFNEGLAALHLVDQWRLVDLDHDSFGIDAEILHQRLRDVAHHADLLFVGAADGHADGDFGHPTTPFVFVRCRIPADPKQATHLLKR